MPVVAPRREPAAQRLRATVRPALAWLLDTPGCSPRARRTLTAATFATFVGLVVLAAAAHDVWRDEARALTLALEAPSWWTIPATLANEGHPALWHVLLRVAHDLTASPLVLPVLAAATGVGAAALVFFAAPLPTWWRVAFLFGWVPLHLGPVLCRNYGIAMLLLFAFCRLVATGPLRVRRAAVALALLANTNVYGTIMAGCFGFVLGVDALQQRVRATRVATAVALVGAGIAVAVRTMLPTAESKLLPSATRALGQLGSTAVDAIVAFGANTERLFGIPSLAWPIVVLAAAGTSCVRHLAIAVLAFFVAVAWFTARIYSAAPHHLGMMFTFLVAATWIRAGRDAGPRCAMPRHRLAWAALLFFVWPALLTYHGYRGLRAVKDEVEYTNSSAPELARLLARPELTGAVLIGEPDYYLDALPWYRDNVIHVAREGRYARRVSWTIANRREWDLGALLASARRVQRDGHRPVLLVIGHPIALDRPAGSVRHGYGDHFVWTESQHREFVAATQHVASLPARPSRFRGDERYEVYRLRD